MEKFKLNIASDIPTMHVPGNLIWAALQMDDVALVSANDADLVLNVDSIHNVGLTRGRKTAYYEIDDYLHLGRDKQYYDVDQVYITSKNLLPLYPEGTKWLPQAMEPLFHHKWDIFPESFDLVFIGATDSNKAYSYRKDILTKLSENFNLLWTTCQPQDYAKYLSQGKILVNVMPVTDGEPYVNVRFFESMGIGCLLQNYHPALDDFAVEGRDYIGFKTIDEAVEKVRYMLTHEEARIRMINNAHQNVTENHTWVQRLRQIINDAREVKK